MIQLAQYNGNSKQNGAALVISLIILVVMTLIALSGMNSSLLQEKMVANSQNSNKLFQAAESAVGALTNKAEQGIDDDLTVAMNDSDRLSEKQIFTINDPSITSSFQARYLGEAKLTTGDTIGGGEDHTRLRTQRFELVGESRMPSVSGNKRIFQGIDYN